MSSFVANYGAKHKFADDRKHGGVADTPKGHAATQRDLHKVEKRASRDLMQFSKGKCKVLHLGRNNLRHQDIGCQLSGITTLQERTWGSWWVTRLNTIKQCGKNANSILGCTRSAAGWRR